jgi:hypothetical protein
MGVAEASDHQAAFADRARYPNTGKDIFAALGQQAKRARVRNG